VRCQCQRWNNERGLWCRLSVEYEGFDPLKYSRMCECLRSNRVILVELEICQFILRPHIHLYSIIISFNHPVLFIIWPGSLYAPVSASSHLVSQLLLAYPVELGNEMDCPDHLKVSQGLGITLCTQPCSDQWRSLPHHPCTSGRLANSKATRWMLM
jgi:hypothetical protein